MSISTITAALATVAVAVTTVMPPTRIRYIAKKSNNAQEFLAMSETGLAG